MIVTIDGPAGSGKSSAARMLADRLGFKFLDTGAMYRAVAWYFDKHQIDPADQPAVLVALNELQLQIDGNRVLVNGRDVSKPIRSPRLSQMASVVAALPPVREFLVGLQRSIARQGDIVCEGRDQGTVVFPDARCKFFLTAAPEIRARRRWLELRPTQPDLDLESVVAEQKIRDLRDETRSTGKLVKAADANEILVDDISLDDLVDHLEQVVHTVIRDQADRTV